MKKVIRAAMDIYATFRGKQPKKLKRVDFDVPVAVAVIGHVDYIGYRTTYGDKSELYEHEFAPGSRPLLCVNPDGRQLVLLGGRYAFNKDHGIVDKDARGREILDPDHGKDIGFMRTRQANPGKKGRKAFYGTERDTMAYRGYLCQTSQFTPKPNGDPGGWRITKDGHHIGLADDAESCKAAIDSLLD
jgi:hypothetical protein